MSDRYFAVMPQLGLQNCATGSPGAYASITNRKKLAPLQHTGSAVRPASTHGRAVHGGGTRYAHVGDGEIDASHDFGHVLRADAGCARTRVVHVDAAAHESGAVRPEDEVALGEQ